VDASLELLRTTLEHAIDSGMESSEAELRHAVDGFVDTRRGVVPPQQLVIEVKELARTTIRNQRMARGESAREDSASRDVVERVVRWAIERYYSR
jgi:hypothetical protein